MSHRRTRIPFSTREEAVQAADKVALREWERGVDAMLDVYWCDACLAWHVGTVKRRMLSDQPLLHTYRTISPPE